jgi:hypothetical protein
MHRSNEMFSLFSSTLTDTFGRTHATTRHDQLRLLYMAQGVGSILGGPLAAWVHERESSAPAAAVTESREMMPKVPMYRSEHRGHENHWPKV